MALFFNWSFTGRHNLFSLLILLLDIITAIGIIFAVAIGFEWRRRRRWRIWQFTLAELLLFTVFLASILGWWRFNHLQFKKKRYCFDQYYGGSEHGPFIRML